MEAEGVGRQTWHRLLLEGGIVVGKRWVVKCRLNPRRFIGSRPKMMRLGVPTGSQRAMYDIRNFEMPSCIL